MANRVERTYGKVLKYAFLAVNPFKKAVIETECIIHKFINMQGLEILKNDQFLDAYNFFSDYIVQLNEGVVWADQDLKSSNHFYSPVKERGLYGRSDALSLATGYYSQALEMWKEGDSELSMFYLGAAVHLVQDMTIPQHANIRLLDNHRQYENFVKRAYLNSPCFTADRGGYYVESIEEAIKCSARNAMKIYAHLRFIQDNYRRYFAITKFTLPLAQKTTAGCFLRFYKDVTHGH